MRASSEEEPTGCPRTGPLSPHEHHNVRMRFTETELAGAFLVDIEAHVDDRGFFARTFCQRELEAHGLDPTVAQGNIAFNHRRGTLRGMHWQVGQAAETKLVRCLRGSIHDVIVDLRADSPTYLHHVAVQLTDENRRALFVPRGVAHGYVTLTDRTEVEYLHSEFYAPAAGRGARYDDPALGISWPEPVTVLSEQDASWPLLDTRGLDE
jgi:dTDP-4-dehydrorhamnose 3,5-epimerase